VFGVDKDARLVLRSWTATFATAAAAKATSKLLLTAAVRPGQASALEYDLELWAAGAWAGRVRMEVGHLSAATYTVIRSRRHGSLPTPADLVPTIGRPVPPARVGRVRSADTLLLDAKATRSTAAARLRVPLGNPSLFDHVQDHVPAMVLVEAARQLAAFALREWGGAPPNQSEMVAMRSSFDRFAELTEPVTMLASPATPAGGRPVDVTFRQARTDVAQVRVVMAAEASQQPAVITRRAA
jgi:hypothetical protein